MGGGRRQLFGCKSNYSGKIIIFAVPTEFAGRHTAKALTLLSFERNLAVLYKRRVAELMFTSFLAWAFFTIFLLGTPRPLSWIMFDCLRFFVVYSETFNNSMKRYFIISALLCLVALCGCGKEETAGNDSTPTPASPSTPPFVSADDIEEEDFGSF